MTVKTQRSISEGSLSLVEHYQAGADTADRNPRRGGAHCGTGPAINTKPMVPPVAARGLYRVGGPSWPCAIPPFIRS